MRGERLTAAQRAWLTRLRDEGVANRGRGTCGITCMRRGWTEWAYQRGSEVVGRTELDARYSRPDDHSIAVGWERRRDDGWVISGEMLTPEGRRALEEADHGG